MAGGGRNRRMEKGAKVGHPIRLYVTNDLMNTSLSSTLEDNLHAQSPLAVLVLRIHNLKDV